DDGKTTHYSFRCRKKVVKLHSHERKEGFIISMSAFESSHLPSESYHYMDRDDGHEMLSERFGAHHRTTIDYYKKGDWVDLYHYEGSIVCPGNIARNRVKQINVAVNDSQDLRTLAQFSYRKNKVTKEAFTDVYNSDRHLTRFHYST